jgi:cell division protein FtsW
MGNKKKINFSSTFFLLFITTVISLIGLLFVFESSTAESFSTFGHPYHYVQSQAAWLVVGFLTLITSSFIPIKFWKKISPLLFIITLIALVMVFVPGFGLKLNGARRWFSFFGLVTIQPVEIAKFSIVTFFAAWMSKHQKLIPLLFLTALPVSLLLLQPDLGSTLIVLAIAMGMYFIAGGKMKYILLISGIGLTLVLAAIFSSEYRMKRVSTFFNPELDPLGSSFHIRQITLALGRGGIMGQGIGESKQKYNYIPEASSDSILAIVAEEVGFVGSFIIISLFTSYFFIAYKIAIKFSSDSFEHILTMGILIWISSQTLLNIAAVVALVPLTGMPLPFFSYGGSSLVMVMLATGVLAKLSKIKQKS